MNIHNLVKSNGIKYNYYRQKFLETFGISLKHFHHPILGFDLIEFDKWLDVPKNISCAQYIEAEFGREAREMVEHLL